MTDLYDQMREVPDRRLADALRVQLHARLDGERMQLDDPIAPAPSSTTPWPTQHRIGEQDITEPTDTTGPTLEVIMLSPDRNESPNTSQRWMMVAASVAALALVGGLIFAATRADEDPVPADQPAPTVPAEPVDDDEGALAIGEAMISAVNERDTAAAAALLADDATVDFGSARNKDDLLKQIDFFSIDSTNFDIESCQPGNVYPVTCVAEFTSELTQPLDGDPITGTFYFRIADGQISALALNMDRNFGDQVLDPWLTFIEQQHPEDFDKMILFDADGFAPLGPQLTEESSILHVAYIAEYVASITSE